MVIWFCVESVMIGEVEARCHVQSDETTHLIFPNHVSGL
jgi:hypothetical protein